MSWQDVHSRVATELAREGHSATEAEAKPLANQAIHQMNDFIRPERKVWTGADWTESGGVVSLPSTFLGPVDSVTYDSYPVQPVTAEEYHVLSDTVLSSIADYVYCITGTQLFTNVPAPADLKVFACKGLGLYTDQEDEPLASLPARFHILPAYYMLALWPHSPDVPAEAARAAQNAGLWREELRALADTLNARRGRPYSG